MAHAFTLDSSIARQAPASGLFTGFRKALSDRMLFQRTCAELGSLSDRDLSDLGIRRHEIKRIAREAVYGA